MERARDQLQELLLSEEINKLDARLAKLVKKGEIDAGFFPKMLMNSSSSLRMTH